MERSTPCESFVRAGSLKAWKEEQARIKAEEEEHARLAEEKRAKSAQKKVRHNILYEIPITVMTIMVWPK